MTSVNLTIEKVDVGASVLYNIIYKGKRKDNSFWLTTFNCKCIQ